MLSKILTLDFLSPYLGSLLRHLLTMISGVFVAAGVATQNQATTWVEATLPIVIAGVLYIWAQVGSWLNKAKQ
jgi:hypothetical protein